MVARLEARGLEMLPSLLVGEPAELCLDHLLVLLTVVPPSELVGDLPWGLAQGPTLGHVGAPVLVLSLVPTFGGAVV